MQDVLYKDINKRDDVVYIDVRSEGEYAESHIPGAVNVPLFDNEERAQVGTVYKQIGKEEAKDLGLKIASAKLPQLVQQVQTAAAGKQPVVYCWRGGMRSKSIATILELMGTPGFRLEGGYRGYRERVKEQLNAYQITVPCVVIHGMTGVGKTELLHNMAAEGEPVLDLEQLAGHKGSAFGSIGELPRNQRMFDSLLLDRLEEIKGAPYIIIEAESKRIGRVNLPDFMLAAKNAGVHILTHAPLPIRVQRTLKQYVVDDPQFKEKVTGALEAIEKKLSPDDRTQAWNAVAEHRYADLVAMLLVQYYDPRYKHSMEQYAGNFIEIDAADLDACKAAVKQTIAQQLALTESGSRT